MEYDEFSAMNTTVVSAAEGAQAHLQRGFARVRRFVAAAEQRFSRFRPTSELSQLNEAAGGWFPVSADMMAVLQEAQALHELTGGLFDPAVLPALINAGYDRNMDELRYLHLPTITQAAAAPPFSAICLDVDHCAVYMPAGMEIDLGGIAKGWIAARAADLLSTYCDACAVSAGGDMALVGLPAGQPHWLVSLEDPRDPERVLSVLRVGPGGLATSSVTRRSWPQGDALRHHIIDPRDGQSARTSWLSVTVFSEKTTSAEALAKALLIAGPHVGPALAGRVPGLRFVAVQPDGAIWGTPASKEMLHVPTPSELIPFR